MLQHKTDMQYPWAASPLANLVQMEAPRSEFDTLHGSNVYLLLLSIKIIFWCIHLYASSYEIQVSLPLCCNPPALTMSEGARYICYCDMQR